VDETHHRLTRPLLRNGFLSLPRKGEELVGRAPMIGIIIAVIVGILVIGLILKILKIAIILAVAVGIVMFAQNKFGTNRIK
jgi:hypothetical protein